MLELIITGYHRGVVHERLQNTIEDAEGSAFGTCEEVDGTHCLISWRNVR